MKCEILQNIFDIQTNMMDEILKHKDEGWCTYAWWAVDVVVFFFFVHHSAADNLNVSSCLSVAHYYKNTKHY